MSLNTLAITPNFGNTGIGKSIIDPLFFKGAILIPKGKVFTATQCLTASALMTALKALIWVTPANGRIFPIAEFNEFKDETVKAMKGTLGNGKPVFLKEGFYVFTFSHNNGLAYHKRLRKFNKLQNKYQVLFFDLFNLYGTTRLDSTGANGLGGFDMFDLFAQQADIGDGKGKFTDYQMTFALNDVTQLNDNYAYVPLSDTSGTFDPITEMKGLKGASLSFVGTPGATSSKVKVIITDDGDDTANYTGLYNNASVLLAQANWKLTNSATGAAITISGVTYDAPTMSYVLTYTSSTGVLINLTLTDSATLKAAIVTAVAGTDVRDGVFIEADNTLSYQL